jgi:hypothetical protein
MSLFVLSAEIEDREEVDITFDSVEPSVEISSPRT